jgi:hypothetical protein
VPRAEQQRSAREGYNPASAGGEPGRHGPPWRK